MKRKLQQLLIVLLLGTSICLYAQIEGTYHSVGYFYHPTLPRAIYLDKALTKVTDSTYTTTIGDLSTTQGILVVNIHKNNTVTYENSKAINGSTNYLITPIQDSINCFDPINKIFNLHYQYTISSATRKVREVLSYFVSFKLNDITYTTTSLTEVGVLKGDSCQGQVIIPTTVTYNGNTYSVTSIGENAFTGDTLLTNVVLPQSIKTIKTSPFYMCKNLSSVNLPLGLESIGDWAFQKTGITSINLPSSVTTLGSNPFECGNLGSLTVQSGNSNFKMIDGVLFSMDGSRLITCLQTKTGSYNIPSSVTIIGNESFGSCSWLSEVLIPNSVTKIEDGAFQNCWALTSINIPNSVTSIGNYTFSWCYGLTSVIIPASVTSIGYQTFFDCTRLTSFTIPYSVTSIGYSAFYGCSSLTSITIPSSVSLIGNAAFAFTSAAITVDASSINYYSSDGVLYNKSQTSLLQCTNYHKASFIIPNSVTSIGINAFAGCTGLTSVNIPSSVTSIGIYAFVSCSGFTSVSIPSSVTFIDNFAFAECTGLTSIYLYSPKPIELNYNTEFQNVNKSSCTLYVPKGSLSLYQSADQWKDFSNIVEFDATAVNNPNNTSLKVYYNQATGSLQLNGIDSSVSISVYDLKGRLCLNRTIMANEAINMKSLPRGMYLIKVVQNNEVVTQKVLL